MTEPLKSESLHDRIKRVTVEAFRDSGGKFKEMADEIEASDGNRKDLMSIAGRLIGMMYGGLTEGLCNERDNNEGTAGTDERKDREDSDRES